MSPPSWYPPMTPTMVPVRERTLKRVTHGLPLVPPVYPAHSNRSWVALCREVQFTQLMGELALSG